MTQLSGVLSSCGPARGSRKQGCHTDVRVLTHCACSFSDDHAQLL
jgi:hypothetical protein